MTAKFVEGDLLDQNVEVIVNAWNRNPFPWWLLIPQGVSAAIRKRAGNQPFRELRRYGLLPLGHAVLTSAGNLPFSAIIHVAGIDLLWRASRTSIQRSTASALAVARQNGFSSIAFPLIGAGTGGMTPSRVEEWMRAAILEQRFEGTVVVVRFPQPPT
jgi:O-acetyl-ADP-ribose deacetylase (regulator of RNase III)